MSLKNINVGDFIFIDFGEDSKAIKKVDKVTKTMVIVGNRRFRKNGTSVGGGYLAPLARPLQEGDYLKIKILRARAYVSKHLNNMSDDLAIEVAKLIMAEQEKNK